MSMTDPIADMLTRIRNACQAKHRRVDMPASKLKTQIAQILKDNAFIQDYKTLETEDGRKVLRVVLKYATGGNAAIYFTQVSAQGVENGNELLLSHGSGVSDYTTALWNGSTFAFCWRDSRDAPSGNTEIYFATVGCAP